MARSTISGLEMTSLLQHHPVNQWKANIVKATPFEQQRRKFRFRLMATQVLIGLLMVVGLKTQEVALMEKEVTTQVKSESEAVELARQAAHKEGYSTKDHDVNAKLSNGQWIIWFSPQHSSPQKRGGGLKVTINFEDGQIISVLRGQ